MLAAQDPLEEAIVHRGVLINLGFVTEYSSFASLNELRRYRRHKNDQGERFKLRLHEDIATNAAAISTELLSNKGHAALSAFHLSNVEIWPVFDADVSDKSEDNIHATRPRHTASDFSKSPDADSNPILRIPNISCRMILKKFASPITSLPQGSINVESKSMVSCLSIPHAYVCLLLWRSLLKPLQLLIRRNDSSHHGPFKAQVPKQIDVLVNVQLDKGLFNFMLPGNLLPRMRIADCNVTYRMHHKLSLSVQDFRLDTRLPSKDISHFDNIIAIRAGKCEHSPTSRELTILCKSLDIHIPQGFILADLIWQISLSTKSILILSQKLNRNTSIHESHNTKKRELPKLKLLLDKVDIRAEDDVFGKSDSL